MELPRRLPPLRRAEAEAEPPQRGSLAAEDEAAKAAAARDGVTEWYKREGALMLACCMTQVGTLADAASLFVKDLGQDQRSGEPQKRNARLVRRRVGGEVEGPHWLEAAASAKHRGKRAKPCIS